MPQLSTGDSVIDHLAEGPKTGSGAENASAASFRAARPRSRDFLGEVDVDPE